MPIYNAEVWSSPTLIQSGVDADLLPVPPPSLPRLPLLLHPCFTHSPPYSLLPLNAAIECLGKFVRLPMQRCSAKKRPSQLQKLMEGTKVLGPHDLQSWMGRVPRVSWGDCA